MLKVRWRVGVSAHCTALTVLSVWTDAAVNPVTGGTTGKREQAAESIDEETVHICDGASALEGVS